MAALAGLRVFGEFFFGAEGLPTASATRLGWMNRGVLRVIDLLVLCNISQFGRFFAHIAANALVFLEINVIYACSAFHNSLFFRAWPLSPM